MITRENYEAYFLDYIEGNLADHVLSELHVFLTENPDLADELDSLRSTPFNLTHEVFSFKNELKKPELPFEYEELAMLLAKEASGDASASERAQIDKLCETYPFLKKQRQAFAKAFFKPQNISFESKETLRIAHAADMSDIQMRMAAAAEGDLNNEELNTLQAEINKSDLLQNEFRLIKTSRLKAQQITFEDKKNISIANEVNLDEVQNLLIAKVEGDLTLEQNEKLSLLLSGNAHMQKQLALLYKTRLKPEAMLFDQKNKLKKKEAAVVPLRRVVASVAAAAAVVAIIVWLGLGEDNNLQLVETKEEVPQQHNTLQQTAQPHLETRQNENPENLPVPKSEKQLWKHDVAIRHTGISPAEEKMEQNQPDVQQKDLPIKVDTAPEENIAGSIQDKEQQNFPDMSPLYSDDLDQAKNNQKTANTHNTSNSTQPLTIWQVLGNAAEKRIEKTAAFALMEKQAERITPVKDMFLYERTEDEIKLKLGRFEMNRDTRKRERSGENKLEKLYKKVAKNG